MMISQFQLHPASPPPPPPPKATAWSVLGVGHLQIFLLPGSRAFTNPGADPELLTRTRFPIRI